jgi:catechol 2,3-dioxygenase-like lactoylglutathione lyase family enzyme
MEMNGVAHIPLTVCDFATCRAFYAKLFAWLNMEVIFDSPQVFYGVGSRTGIAISPAYERTAASESHAERDRIPSDRAARRKP